MRSGPQLSVHATWRAIDFSGTKAQRKELVEFLFKHRDALNIEEIHSYDGVGVPMPTDKWGAGYRSSRDNWLVYTISRNAGTPQAGWTHVEVAPILADNPKLVEETFARIFAG
jgi:hypothetical protein